MLLQLGKLAQGETWEHGKAFSTLNKFYATACHIHEELGSWASKYYVIESIRRLASACSQRQAIRLGEYSFVAQRLSGLNLDEAEDADCFSNIGAVSDKVQRLVQFLTTDEKAARSGIVFVERRATVAVLAKLLSIHPRTKDIIKTGTFVGMSTSTSGVASIGDWLGPSQQQNTLGDFRARESNLVIATSALEEGIDISACNAVICFSKPANLKSFIQRRGRARERGSTFVLMLSSEEGTVGAETWEALERELMAAYLKDMEERRAAQSLEEVEEKSEERFEVESTRYVALDRGIIESSLPQGTYHLRHCSIPYTSFL